jgi:hypothetical protein
MLSQKAFSILLFFLIKPYKSTCYITFGFTKIIHIKEKNMIFFVKKLAKLKKSGVLCSITQMNFVFNQNFTI